MIPINPPPSQFLGPLPSNMKTCGTHGVSWIDGGLPELGDTPKNIDIKFAYTNKDDQWKSSGGDQAVACDDGYGHTFYLYYLNSAPTCSLAYCVHQVLDTGRTHLFATNLKLCTLI